jgi:hypothetical protein
MEAANADGDRRQYLNGSLLCVDTGRSSPIPQWKDKRRGLCMLGVVHTNRPGKINGIHAMAAVNQPLQPKITMRPNTPPRRTGKRQRLRLAPALRSYSFRQKRCRLPLQRAKRAVHLLPRIAICTDMSLNQGRPNSSQTCDQPATVNSSATRRGTGKQRNRGLPISRYA